MNNTDYKVVYNYILMAYHNMLVQVSEWADYTCMFINPNCILVVLLAIVTTLVILLAHEIQSYFPQKNIPTKTEPSTIEKNLIIHLKKIRRMYKISRVEKDRLIIRFVQANAKIFELQDRLDSVSEKLASVNKRYYKTSMVLAKIDKIIYDNKDSEDDGIMAIVSKMETALAVK